MADLLYVGSPFLCVAFATFAKSTNRANLSDSRQSWLRSLWYRTKSSGARMGREFTVNCHRVRCNRYVVADDIQRLQQQKQALIFIKPVLL